MNSVNAKSHDNANGPPQHPEKRLTHEAAWKTGKQEKSYFLTGNLPAL